MNNFASPNRRHGLTLVEMMVSVVLTLMVVFAVVRVFESLGESVTDGRATIEMSGSLRTAARILQDDLDGLTVSSLPPRSPSQKEGYLELIDGPSTDAQYPIVPAGGAGSLDPVLVSKVVEGGQDVDGDGYLDNSVMDTCVGDVDDILAFTSYRPERPFLGTISHPRITTSLTGNIITSPAAPTAIIESEYAEVVWWLQVERTPNGVGLDQLGQAPFYDNPTAQIALANGMMNAAGNNLTPQEQFANIQRYPNVAQTAVRSLRRRVLLIRPDLNLENIVLQGQSQLDEFLTNNDISVRIIRDTSDPNRFTVVPNTLADLADRENRAYRSTWVPSDGDRTDLRRTRLNTARLFGVPLDPSGMLMRQGAMKDMLLQFSAGQYADSAALGITGDVDVIMLRKGKDIVLNDVMAFDLQVWDPEARIRGLDGTVLLPSDPGYVAGGNLPVVGGFVDLGFGVWPKVPKPLGGSGQFVSGQFAGYPNTKSQIVINKSGQFPALLVNGLGTATYCTWSSSYEHDGIDQDGDGLADEGHDGLDNPPFVLGTDDPGELETSPPYPHALRGLKVTLRAIDFATRQVRQTSVTKDFLPE